MPLKIIFKQVYNSGLSFWINAGDLFSTSNCYSWLDSLKTCSFGRVAINTFKAFNSSYRKPTLKFIAGFLGDVSHAYFDIRHKTVTTKEKQFQNAIPHFHIKLEQFLNTHINKSELVTQKKAC